MMPRKKHYLLSIAEQLKQLDTSRIAVIQANDGDALHNFRVALRSLRTLLPAVLQHQKNLDRAILQTWKALAKLSNPSRDAEVMIELLGSRISPAQQQTLKSRYETTIAQLKIALQSPKLSSLMNITLQQCQRRLKKISMPQLKQIIQAQQHAHIQTLQQSPSTPTLQQWHERRITIKQLRYLSELAATWLPPSSSALLPKLKAAQTSLGDLHDAFTLSQYLGNNKIKKSRWLAAERDWNQLISYIKGISTQ